MYNFLFLLFSHKFKFSNYFFSLHIRSSYLEGFCKMSVLKIFCRIHRKTPLLESLFNNLQAKPATLLKRDYHRCFPVKFMRFLRTPLVAASDICSLITFYFHNISVAKLAKTSQINYKAQLHYGGQ